LPALSEMLLGVLTHPRPVVAAIGGHAIAGGALLALACDYRLMSAGRFGFAELAVGVPFPTVALELLRLAAGPKLRRIVLSGSTVPVDDAVGLGLVDESAEPERLLGAARDRAEVLGAIPAQTFLLTKSQLIAPAIERIEKDRRDKDPEVLSIWTSNDVTATMVAYLARLAETSSKRS
jgi:enoyl-CoA hydratase